jgi:hypothetical protein
MFKDIKSIKNIKKIMSLNMFHTIIYFEIKEYHGMWL